MKLHDNKKSVEIRMMSWNGTGYNPDWSDDFFDAGSLDYDEDRDSYRVDDVDYCIEQAQDWQYGRGDYAVDADDYLMAGETEEDAERRMQEDLDNRTVEIEKL